MSKRKQQTRQQKRTSQLADLTQEEAEAVEQEWMREMVGDEDAAYFHHAGIDDIGNK
jgi:hypothetical protein